MGNLAMAYERAGQTDKAVPLHQESYHLRRATLGPDHPVTLAAMNNLAAGYSAASRHDEAVELYQELLPSLIAKHGLEHPHTLNLRRATWPRRSMIPGNTTRPWNFSKRPSRLLSTKLGHTHPRTLTYSSHLADRLSWRFGRTDEAVKLREEARLRKRKDTLGPDHPDTLERMHNLARAYNKSRQYDKATKLSEETLQLRLRILGEDHPDTLWTMNVLADDIQGCPAMERCHTVARENAGDA